MNRFCILLLSMVVLQVTSVSFAATLSNGFAPIITDGYSLSYYSSQAVDRKINRSIAKLAKEVEEVLNKGRKLGISLTHKVHIRIYEDLHVPSRDVWLSYGVEPSEARFRDIQEKSDDSFCALTYGELVTMRTAIFEAFPFLRLHPTCYAANQYELDNYEDCEMKLQPEVACALVQMLAKTIDEPLSSNSRLYSIAQMPCFVPSSHTIWLPHKDRKKNLHRQKKILTHEVGHYLFHQLAHQLAKVHLGKECSKAALACLLKSMLPINELFADYTALSSGNNPVISLHLVGSADVPEEIKRYFSKERTLLSFMKEHAAAGDYKTYFEDGHNSLNPSRSFLHKLKHELHTETVDKLFKKAVERQLVQLFTEDLETMQTDVTEYAGEKITYITNYPQDIASVNLIFMRNMEAAADGLLNEEERDSFNEIVTKVYEGGVEYYQKGTQFD